ncbi:hypothetical protein [Streptacidiphilus jeojiensis]|uniref:hypothetical protein n=1 Tax=Streptacidiphilus jeojiensis TaxID=3229225 RepID=UPI0036D434F3
MLDQHGVAPVAVVAADALAGTDDPKVGARVQGAPGGVRGSSWALGIFMALLTISKRLPSVSTTFAA